MATLAAVSGNTNSAFLVPDSVGSQEELLDLFRKLIDPSGSGWTSSNFKDILRRVKTWDQIEFLDKEVGNYVKNYVTSHAKYFVDQVTMENVHRIEGYGRSLWGKEINKMYFDFEYRKGAIISVSILVVSFLFLMFSVFNIRDKSLNYIFGTASIVGFVGSVVYSKKIYDYRKMIELDKQRGCVRLQQILEDRYNSYVGSISTEILSR